jgi:6,7-dimethyl-8-ribityllumazine synthase
MGDAEGAKATRNLRLCLVVSRFNESVTAKLEEGARRCLESQGVPAGAIDTVHVPGAWELPLAVRLVLDHEAYDGVVALGCVIRGETPHFEYVAMGATTGLEAVARETRVPVGFGLLTTDDGEQALARAGGGKGNKGEEAAHAVLDMCEFAAGLR